MGRIGICLISLSIFFINFTFAAVMIQNIEVNILDKSIVSCTVNMTGENPKSVDFKIKIKKALTDVILYFESFTLLNNGEYDELLPREEISICVIPSTEHLMANFVYREVSKVSQSSIRCPIMPGEYHIRGVKIFSEDIPSQLTIDNVKLEVNGSYFEPNFKLRELFTTVIYLVAQQN
ncbi:hypothetical protein PVAND_001864 [Polypedilum vanderplanki]|uniref:MD-2-related lipid-recognition domain-containing protein n=1 Tax=Polypedilum vanderplanki TaxID=319348 RepID=A0A9J6BP93_POLVA|nr:hypothetical protein PVAND_001864 [Polypedilum vanderplanki]